MIKIRERLTDALRDAFQNVPAGVNDDWIWANYLADVLLSTPGIDITDVSETEALNARWRTFVRLNPEKARGFATSLLAAVQAQED